MRQGRKLPADRHHLAPWQCKGLLPLEKDSLSDSLTHLPVLVPPMNLW